MTVSAAYAPKSFSCNGVTKDFPFTFPIISETDLVVAVSTGAVKALQNLGQHYTVSINGTKGGTVSMLTAPASGTLTIERAVPILQPASIRNQKVFAPATIEDEMDRACMIDQQLQVQLDDQASDLEALQNLQLGSATVTALLTGSISGNVLTITAITGIVAPGMALSYLGSPAGLALQALGTGTGGTGTYILNQTLGTVGSQAMTAAGAGALVLLGILGALASSNAGLGDALMAVLAPYTGAVATTQRQVNSEMVSVFRFFTAAQIADVVARTCTLNLNSAMVNAVASGKRLFFPNGTYLWDQVSFPAGNIYWEGESMEGVVFRFSGAQPIGIKTGWVNNLNNHVILRNFSLDTSQLPALATSIGLQIQYCWGNHLENIKDHTVPGVGRPVLPANAYSLHVGFSVYTSLFDNMELQAIKVAGNSGSDASSCLVFNDWDGAYANLINLFSIKFQGGAVQNGQPNTYPAKFDFTGCVHVTLDTLDIEGSGLFLRYNGTNNFDINLVNCQLSPLYVGQVLTSGTRSWSAKGTTTLTGTIAGSVLTATALSGTNQPGSTLNYLGQPAANITLAGLAPTFTLYQPNPVSTGGTATFSSTQMTLNSAAAGLAIGQVVIGANGTSATINSLASGSLGALGSVYNVTGTIVVGGPTNIITYAAYSPGNVTAQPMVAVQSPQMCNWQASPEQKTFQVAAVTTGGSVTLAQNFLEYTRIGNRVFFSGSVLVGSVSSPTGELTLTGMPYLSLGPTGAAAISVFGSNLAAGAATEIGGYITNNDNRLYIRAFAAGNPVALAQYVQAGTVLYLSGHYPIGEGVQA